VRINCSDCFIRIIWKACCTLISMLVYVQNIQPYFDIVILRSSISSKWNKFHKAQLSEISIKWWNLSHISLLYKGFCQAKFHISNHVIASLQTNSRFQILDLIFELAHKDYDMISIIIHFILVSHCQTVFSFFLPTQRKTVWPRKTNFIHACLCGFITVFN